MSAGPRVRAGLTPAPENGMAATWMETSVSGMATRALPVYRELFVDCRMTRTRIAVKTTSSRNALPSLTCGRVEVPARDFGEGVEPREQREAETERDDELGERDVPARQGVARDDPRRAHEDEDEGAEQLGQVVLPDFHRSDSLLGANAGRFAAAPDGAG